MKRVVLVSALGTVLAVCNTRQGMGKALRQGGIAIERAANS
ncbi:MAG TPA: entericidin [Burkholderiales bacterium]|nr:entericidin [Burkholderiales bacterium]